MSTLILRFGESEKIPTGGSDYHCWYRFPFTVVDSEFIGSPEENFKTSNHTLDVIITSTERAGWEFSEADLRKVMFEIGRRKVMEKASRNELSNQRNGLCESVRPIGRLYRSLLPTSLNLMVLCLQLEKKRAV